MWDDRLAQGGSCPGEGGGEGGGKICPSSPQSPPGIPAIALQGGEE